MLARFLKLFQKPAEPALGAARSGSWPRVRAEHLEREPECRVCGTTSGLAVHHRVPVHIDPSRELDPMNLITLCNENGCHYLVGHGRDWKAYNPSVDPDCAKMRGMIARRKYE